MAAKRKGDGIRYLIVYVYTIPFESSTDLKYLLDVLFIRTCAIFRSALTEPTNWLNLNACELLCHLLIWHSEHLLLIPTHF